MWADASDAQRNDVESNCTDYGAHSWGSNVLQLLNKFVDNHFAGEFSWTKTLSTPNEFSLEVSEHEGFADGTDKGDENKSNCEGAEEKCNDLLQEYLLADTGISTESTDDSFEPHDFHAGILQRRRTNTQRGLPSWSRNQVTSGGRKRVSFSEDIELVLDLEGASSIYFLNDASCQILLRHFWHLDGQIASFETMISILNQFTRAGQCANQMIENGFDFSHIGLDSRSSNDCLPHSTVGPFTGALWWNDIKILCEMHTTQEDQDHI